MLIINFVQSRESVFTISSWRNYLKLNNLKYLMVSYQALPHTATLAKGFWLFLHSILFATLASQPNGIIYLNLFSGNDEFQYEIDALLVSFIITTFFYFYTGYVGNHIWLEILTAGPGYVNLRDSLDNSPTLASIESDHLINRKQKDEIIDIQSS